MKNLANVGLAVILIILSFFAGKWSKNCNKICQERIITKIDTLRIVETITLHDTITIDRPTLIGTKTVKVKKPVPKPVPCDTPEYVIHKPTDIQKGPPVDLEVLNRSIPDISVATLNVYSDTVRIDSGKIWYTAEVDGTLHKIRLGHSLQFNNVKTIIQEKKRYIPPLSISAGGMAIYTNQNNVFDVGPALNLTIKEDWNITMGYGLQKSGMLILTKRIWPKKHYN